MKKLILILVFWIYYSLNTHAQCVNLTSSTIRLNSITSGSPSTCNYTFTPVASISGNAVKLAVVTLTIGANVYNICYTNTGTNIIGTYNGTVPCGSTNDKLSSGNTTFPSVTFTAPCGNTSFQYAGYNGASTGGGTGLCTSGTVPITFTPSLSSSGTSLPVKLKQFSAKLNKDKYPELFWEIDDAENFKEFVVQKSSDAIHFENIKVVKFSNLISKYNFVDSVSLDSQTSYYRLRMNDLDASFKYSSIISLNISEIDKLVFYPNPSFDNVINYNKTIKKDDIIGVFDSSGKKIDFINKNDTNQLEILGNDAGSVFIKFKEEGKINTERILLIR